VATAFTALAPQGWSEGKLSKKTQCPYRGCNGSIASGAEECGAKGHPVVVCKSCKKTGERTANRPLSRYCRICAQRLPEREEWSYPRGSAHGGGLAKVDFGERDGLDLGSHPVFTVKLEAACAGLLWLDGVLCAIDQLGQATFSAPTAGLTGAKVSLGDGAAPRSALVAGGLLVGGRRVTAYPAGQVLEEGAAIAHRWHLDLGGISVGPPFQVGDQVLVLVGDQDSRWKLVHVTRLDQEAPSSKVMASGRGTVTTLCRVSQDVCFLCEEKGAVHRHTLERTGERWKHQQVQIPTAQGIHGDVPLAAVGRMLVAIIGPQRSLWQIDPSHPRLERRLITQGTRDFCVAGFTRGLALLGGEISFFGDREAPGSGDSRPTSSPVSLSKRGALVGLEDGRVRWIPFDGSGSTRSYRLAALEATTVATAPITAICAARKHLAFGNADGTVCVYRMA